MLQHPEMRNFIPLDFGTPSTYFSVFFWAKDVKEFSEIHWFIENDQIIVLDCNLQISILLNGRRSDDTIARMMSLEWEETSGFSLLVWDS